MKISRSNFFILILCVLVVAAWFRAESFSIHSEFQNFYGQKNLIRGKIVNDPEEKNGRENLEVQPDGFKQKILITVFSGGVFEYGDYVYIEGKITQPKPFADFDYPNYLAAKNIYAAMFLPK